MKAIVIYFSHSGNTRKAAEHIANVLQVDIASINPDASSPNSWKQLNFNPDNYSDYIIGFPIIDGSIPQHLYAFLSSLDWRGRKVYPFCTMGGYLGDVGFQLHKACQQASIKNSLKLRFIDGVCDYFDKEINEWIAYVKADARIF